MLFAGLVVQQRAPFDQAGERRRIERRRAVGVRRERGDRLFQQIQRDARVAVGVHRERRERRLVGIDASGAEAALLSSSARRRMRDDVVRPSGCRT